MGYSIFLGNFYQRKRVDLSVDSNSITVSHNFISNKIPNATYVNAELNTSFISYILRYDYRVILNFGEDKVLISRDCILLLYNCAENELSFSDIKAVLLLEVCEPGSSYEEEYHKIYINRKHESNTVVKYIMKKVKDYIEMYNISVIHRELFVKDMVILPLKDLTFNYVDTILAKLRYVLPVAISEEVVVQPLELIEEQPTHLIDDSDDEFGSEFDEDDYEVTLENVEIQSVEAESTQLVPVINVEQTTAVTTIMSLEKYIAMVIDSEEPIRRIQSHVSLLQ